MLKKKKKKKSHVAASSPDPAAVGRDADAGRRRLVRDRPVAVATAVLEDHAHLDGALIVGAGNVEGQAGARVTPDGRSVQAEGRRGANDIKTFGVGGGSKAQRSASRAGIQPGFLAYQVGGGGTLPT